MSTYPKAADELPVSALVGESLGNRAPRACSIVGCREVSWVPRDTPRERLVVCPDHARALGLGTAPPVAAPKRPSWKARRRERREARARARAADLLLSKARGESTARRERTAALILSEGERAALAERFEAWDLQETERVTADLLDDLRVLHPTASDAQLLAFVADLKDRAELLRGRAKAPTEVRP